MMLFRRLFLLVFLMASLSLSGQYTKEFKRVFLDAAYLYETEFYEEAFNRYKNLLILDPGNSNILFHCGACCLHIPGSEQKAITYLAESIAGVTPSYKDNAYQEPGAPVIAQFMLGRAYHLHNEFDLAVENYEIYLEIGTDEDPLQREFTKLQIAACKRAPEVTSAPPSFEFQSVLDHFADYLPSCSNPVISGDGNILIFLVDYPSDKKIMMTVRDGELWSKPRVINSEIGMVGETYPVSLSYDGTELYVVHKFYSRSDIFISTFEEGRWSEAEALGANINGRTSEIHASISKDGNTLYFTSDVRGGYGSFDIYVSRKDEKGEWGLASNLGPAINTLYEEHTPFISSNDSILFFSSQGHASIGGIDVFFSELGADGNWGEPTSLGYPVNTTGEDLFFNPGWNELDGIYAVRKEDDPTSNTINMVIALDPVELTASVEESDSIVEEAPVEEAPVEVALVEVSPQNPEPVTEPEPEPVTVIVPVTQPLSSGSTELNTSIPFDHNDFKLNMAALLEVEKLADLMFTYPEARVELAGHADYTGAPVYNMLLSLQRADQVAQYLEMRGVPADRISVIGKGEDEPVARNRYPDGDDAPIGRYLNRHVLVKVSGQTPMESFLAVHYVPRSLRFKSREEKGTKAAYWFTIQLKASYSPLGPSKFRGLENIEEHICNDKYHRYTYGAFKDFTAAREELKNLRKMGFVDAYIQTLEWYERAKK